MGLAAATAFASCDYLNIVPDEIPSEKDAFADPQAAKRYVYSCYSYLPVVNSGPGSLDLFTGDEVASSFEHEQYAKFPQGNFSSSTPVISYWNTLFGGLRQCYLFLENVGSVPNLRDDLRADYEAQVKFLIGYYHFLLIRCYGPTIVIRGVSDINTPVEDYAAREPLDQCVQFVCDILDEAATVLPARRQTNEEFGLATSVAAKAVKAKLLLMAASPLFNAGGGSSVPQERKEGVIEMLSNLANRDGTKLMPQTYDPQKWEKCRTAMKEAIDLARENGYDLYQKTDYNTASNTYPDDEVQHRLRYNMMATPIDDNNEMLFAYTIYETAYGLQNKSLPFVATACWNGVSPTRAMLSRFYTKNGLPWDIDPATRYLDPLAITSISDDSEGSVGEQTLQFNINREPRFYAWVAFQGGWYELKENNQQPYGGAAASGRLVCNFLNPDGNCARQERTSNYSPTCYLNKKGVNPGFAVSSSLQTPSGYPWPLIRLADLYLGYAEACVETGELAEAMVYLDYVRERAGIPGVSEAWTPTGYALDQNRMREIVRQERQIELYLENNNFWDMRRWLLAREYFNVKAEGLNDSAATIEEMARWTEVPAERKFDVHHYLLPIPIDDLNRNVNLVNNPGYGQ